MAFEVTAQDVTVKEGLYYSGNKLYTGTYTSLDANGKPKANYEIVEGKANGVDEDFSEENNDWKTN